MSDPIDPPADLVGAVLVRTSGPACDSARARLCDRVDGLLGPVDDQLVGMHAAHCGDCRSLALVLIRLAADLPALAAIEPDPRFLTDVLLRTTRRPARPAALLQERLAAGWRHLAQRPRIAWEGAYVGALVLILLFGTPDAPFAAVPAKALDLVRTAEIALPAPSAARAEGASRLRAAVSSRLEETKTRMNDASRDLAERARRVTSGAWEGLRKIPGTIRGKLASWKTTNDASRTGSAGDGKGDR